MGLDLGRRALRAWPHFRGARPQPVMLGLATSSPAQVPLLTHAFWDPQLF